MRIKVIIFNKSGNRALIIKNAPGNYCVTDKQVAHQLTITTKEYQQKLLNDYNGILENEFWVSNSTNVIFKTEEDAIKAKEWLESQAIISKMGENNGII
jgi:predicted proteasome-type protease